MSSISPNNADLCDLYPVAVPIGVGRREWDGPIRQVAAQVAQTWAIQGKDRRRFYVTDEQAASWDQAGVDWQGSALRNADALGSGGGFGSKEDGSGQAYLKVMLNDDALGPSRLFVPHLFEQELGPDYQVAVPELTCALAFRRDLTLTQEAEIDGIIARCYSAGSVPVTLGRFAAHEFWIR